MNNYGVIGLGRMGSAIAQRVAQQGAPVVGWTRSGHPVEGVETLPNLGALVERANTLVLSLFDNAAVSEVLDALLALDLSGKQIIETSTVVPSILKTRVSRIEAAGATAVDAPISGGPEMVLAGTCGVFIGGSDAAAKGAEEALHLISHHIFHVGPLGAGLVMKTINNGMIQTYVSGLADFMPLARRAGLPMETAIKILAGGPAGSPFLNTRLPKVLGEDDTIGFTVAAAKKDQAAFSDIFASFDLKSRMLERYGQLASEAIAEGLGEEDPAVMIPWAYGTRAPD